MSIHSPDSILSSSQSSHHWGYDAFAFYSQVLHTANVEVSVELKLMYHKLIFLLRTMLCIRTILLLVLSSMSSSTVVVHFPSWLYVPGASTSRELAYWLSCEKGI